MEKIKTLSIILICFFCSIIIEAEKGEGISATGISSSLKIEVITPNGSEIWAAGSTQNITWNGPEQYITSVNIELSTDSGTTWTVIDAFAPVTGLSYSWFVPNTPSQTCLLKISSDLIGNLVDVSNSVFTIDSVKIQIAVPNGGEIWYVDSTETITWTGTEHFVDNVKIEYSIDSGSTWAPVAASVPGIDLSYSWLVPKTPSNTCFVKISDVLNSGLFDISDSVFSIDSIGCVQIGSLTVCGDNITELAPNKYSISGNVDINNILNCSGELIVDINELSIVGNGLISLNDIPALGEVQLYSGSFSFNVQDALLNGVLDKANNLFSLAELPVELTNIEILNDGVRIEGKLVFPEVMGNFGAEITTLQITTTNGVDLVGGVHINSIGFSGLKLENILFNFNTIDDIFEGGATLVTNPLSITAGVLITQGQLDSIGVWVVLGNPIPLGVTGFSLSEGGGYVAGIANPPMKLALGISLVPSIQGSFDVVQLNNLDLIYTFGRSIEGSGDLTIFGKDLAQAQLLITNSKTSFSGEINMWDILAGQADATISRRSNGNLNFVGNLSATLQLPDQDYFPFDLIGKIITLPYTLANTENHISNAKIWGEASLTSHFKLSYSIKWVNPGIETEWATEFSLWNSIFKLNTKMNNLALNSINRFEGKSVILNPNQLNKNLKIINTDLVQKFTIINSTPNLVIRLRGNANMPVYSIKLPNGNVVDNSNVNVYNNIEYYEDNVSLKGFYIIQNPQVGEYTLIISNVSTYYLDLYGSNSSPDIIITDVINNGSSLKINWNDSDPDDNAKIDLYYDNNQHGFDGELITEGIDEDDEVNSYNWQIGDMETGNIYIYAEIHDSTSSPSISYFNTPISISNASAPGVPQNLEYSISDTSVTLSWLRPTGGNYNYNVYYSTLGEVNYNSPSFNLGDTATFNFTNLIPGKVYNFAVTSSDLLYHESNLSNIVTVNYVSATQNNSPTILEQEFPSFGLINKQLNYKINVFDADNDVLTFILINSPEGLTVNNEGQLSWLPSTQQIGKNLVSFIVDDNNGLQDSTSFQITVLDSISSTGSINLNKPYYYSYNDDPFVTVQDINLNVSPSKIDSQEVHIYSRADFVGINLVLYETNLNSGIFSNTFGLSKNSSDINILNVSSQDTILAVYVDDFPADTIISINYFIDSITVDVNNDFNSYPKKYKINNAYPNPFNPSTTIQYYLPETASVKLSIYNSLGQLIKILVDEEKTRGSHLVQWNGTNKFGKIVSSGIYFYRFEAHGLEGGKIISKKMILLK